MATVGYELSFSDHVDTVSRIRFSNKILEGPALQEDYDPVNRKYKNDCISGVISNGFSILIEVEASGTTGGEIIMKAEVDGKKTTIYPIRKTDINGVYSLSAYYKIRQ